MIYVNDNYGHWHSDKSRLVAAFTEGDYPGRNMVKRIAPREDDDFVIKPQMSGFYATNLPALLPKLGVSRLLLTGMAADICMLFTAADAHMRAYDLWIPSDAVASEETQRKDWALEIMRKSMGADTRSTDDLPLPNMDCQRSRLRTADETLPRLLKRRPVRHDLPGVGNSHRASRRRHRAEPPEDLDVPGWSAASTARPPLDAAYADSASALTLTCYPGGNPPIQGKDHASRPVRVLSRSPA